MSYLCIYLVQEKNLIRHPCVRIRQSERNPKDFLLVHLLGKAKTPYIKDLCLWIYFVKQINPKGIVLVSWFGKIEKLIKTLIRVYLLGKGNVSYLCSGLVKQINPKGLIAASFYISWVRGGVCVAETDVYRACVIWNSAQRWVKFVYKCRLGLCACELVSCARVSWFSVHGWN